jgi:hypothetical protein
MRRTISHALRAMFVATLFSLGGLVSRASAQAPSAGEDSTFFRTYPMAWVYRGVALYTAKDYERAISAWHTYLPRALNQADSAGADALIRDAWVHLYPMALYYDGYARYVNYDIGGAINSLEQYIELAPAGTDTASIRQVIVKVLIPEQDLAKLP